MSKILLIEPDKPLAGIYSQALKQAGHRVTVVSGSQEAINAADAHCPDVVVLEIQLVSHSGIEFLHEFRSYPDWQNVPVLIHTSVPFIELQDGWPILNSYLGVKHYRYKPSTNLKDLIGSVNELAKSSE